MSGLPYDLDLIEALKNANTSERIEYFGGMFNKNKAFFKTESPEILNLLENSSMNDFEIKMTESFFDIENINKSECIHPKGKLDEYSKLLGEWLHNQWCDLTNFKVAISMDEKGLQGKTTRAFNKALLSAYPALMDIFNNNTLNLKSMESYPDARYSPAVAFIGVSHGLHIVNYLNKAIHNHVFIYEPDLQKFILSCHFIDYEQIKANSSKYYLALGESGVKTALRAMMQATHFAPLTWTRVLVGDDVNGAKEVVEAIKSQQISSTEIFYPIDPMLNSYKYFSQFLKNKLPILSSTPKLSVQSSIAIVASGPSLTHDLNWLRENQNNLIIFVVLSAVSVLVENNIKPDFVFTLDTRVDLNRDMSEFKLPKDVPLVSIYNTSPVLVDLVDTTLLCGAKRNSNIVKFKHPLEFNGCSTANFTLGFAVLCQPKSIFLLGCDCAYESSNKPYAQDSIHFNDGLTKEQIEFENQLHTTTTQFTLKQNFNQHLEINTNTELFTTLLSHESIIKEFNRGSEVYNLATKGAYIQGAKPKRSKDISLSSMNKSDNIEKIIASFEPAEEGNNWFSFNGKSSDLLEAYKKNIIEHINVPHDNWFDMVKTLDFVLYDKRIALQQDESDGRLFPYQTLFESLLRMIYNYILRVDFFSDALEIYNFGVKEFIKQVENIKWPEELNEF